MHRTVSKLKKQPAWAKANAKDPIPVLGPDLLVDVAEQNAAKGFDIFGTALQDPMHDQELDAALFNESSA